MFESIPVPSRRVLQTGLAACVALMLAGASLADDQAAGRSDADVSSIGTLVADDTLDPRIVALELVGPSWDASVAALDAALFAREDAERRRDVARTALVATRAELDAVSSALVDARGRAADVDARIDDHIAVLQARALALFVSFGDEDQLDELESIDEATQGARQRQLADEVDEHQLGLLAVLETERLEIGSEIEDLQGRQVALEANEAALDLSHETATADLAAVQPELEAAIERVRGSRRQARIDALDISVVALDAYLRAEVGLAESLPACGLEWWMIAGVGRVESRHGELGARTITASGRPDRPIIGIALDGGPGVRAITDTDGGALDGDAVWDRAVGPMQFIPETWRIRGRDGDGDGDHDPQNIYDAALASGTYLCRLGGDLADRDNLREAYFGYNTSSHYVDLVERHADRYAEFSLPEVGVESD